MIHSVPQQPLGIRQRAVGQQQPSMAKPQITDPINNMAIGMCVQIVIAELTNRGSDLHQDDEHFRALARTCKTAVKAIFEELGVIEHDKGEQGE